ncbi:hypothetical protein FIBSPDRAFT_687741, partial [Athelia psychrophila]
PQQAMALSICSNKYPFLGFTLADVRWEGPLLEHLRLPSKLPIDGQYALSQQVAMSWNRLEIGLVGMVLTIADTCNLLWPVEVEQFPGPGSHGYMEPRETANHMKTAVLRAHDVFLPLMVLCSYTIAV